MILMIIRSGIFWMQDTFKWTLKLMKYTVLKGAIFLFVLLSLLWLSIFLYASFYYMYMPAESHVRPANFAFRVCENGAGLCSFPSANISLLKDNKDEILARGQVYRIMLELDLPESPSNQQLGMFMVSIKMYDKDREVLQSSTRTALLRYRSSLLQTLNTFVFSPLFLFGMAEQKQMLPVELFSNYVDNPFRPSVGAIVVIENQKIELYSAHLRIYANFSGLRYLMFNWPTACTLVGVGTNMFFLSALAILSWYQWFWSSSHLEFNDRLEFSDNVSLEERRKKIRDVIKKEKESQGSISIPVKGRRSVSSAPVVSQTKHKSKPVLETLGADSLTDALGENQGEITDDSFKKEESLLLPMKDLSNESIEGQIRHRHTPSS